jgi:ACS family phthalate transporter-like MFS transporter
MTQAKEHIPASYLVSRPVNNALYTKVTWRILPFLFICYVLNFVDRVNISFAQVQFKQDLGITDASYGLGVGLFFIGYVLFEVPSNLLMQKIGARRTISRIMVLWGIVSGGMMFIRTPAEFYLARILLGAAEAGFFPGVVLYLTYWFPSARRARITSQFLMAVAVAGILGGPISGWIMANLSGVRGLHGWQWLFLLEGIPAALAGAVAYFYLDDRPTGAKWLTAEERALVKYNLDADDRRKHAVAQHDFLRVLANPRIYVVALGYMVVPWAGSVLNFWGPSVIRKSGIADIWHVGLLSTIPYAVGAASMLFISRNSDRHLERRWYFASMAFLAALGIALLPGASSDWVATIGFLTLASVGYLSAVALFWTIPPAYLSGTAAAGGIALISCIGQAGGLLAPIVIGRINELTGNLALGLYVVAAVIVVGGLTVIMGLPARMLRERSEGSLATNETTPQAAAAPLEG